MSEEVGYLAVILKELDDFGIQAGELAVVLVLAGIVDGPAVEHIATSVAGIVSRDAFLVGKTEDLDFQPLVLRHFIELRQSGQFVKHFIEVRIFSERLPEKLPQIAHGIRHAAQEMRLLLEIAAETVGAQDLKRPEEDKQPESGVEVLFADVHVGFQRLEIGADEFLAQGLRIARPGLPDKGSDIVVDRTLASSLEIDEIRLAVLDHDVPCLEISVHEGLPHVLHDVILHPVEIILKPYLIEFQACSLQETILEIIQVKHHQPLIEGRLGIADAPVEVFGPLELNMREHLHRAAEQPALIGAVLPAFASPGDHPVELVISQIFLNIPESVTADSQDVRHLEPFLEEMAGKGDEGIVLLPAGTYDTDNGDISAFDAEISPVASGRGQLFHRDGLLAGIFFEQLLELIHKCQ